jgi:type I restriction enzyme, R subunit
MTSHAYSEKALVEESTLEILVGLGWARANAQYETFVANGANPSASTFGRASNRDVTLPLRLRAALERLNPDAPPAAIDVAIDELTRDRTAMGIAAANREVHALLTEGVKVTMKDAASGLDEPRTLRVIDWDTSRNNDFIAVQQLVVQGPLYKCIPDVVLFVNGLPLVIIELKKPSVPDKEGFVENLTSYKHEQNGAPRLFAFNAMLVTSNGTASHVGSLTADWERFFEWKRVEREDEPRRVSLEVLLRGTCDPGRLLDMVNNFTLFSQAGSGLGKIIGQNHQYLGVNNTIAATLAARAAGHGRAGVFWQTQGSGKSYSMVFYAQKILRTVPGNWTFVVVTDRIELDDQIAKTFAACGAVEDATACHAETAAHLRELLAGNQRYVFTLVHKFKTTDVLCDRADVIVMVDEAHRSQYDTLALNMRAALPNALFVAFTGTPLLAGEERTKEMFGDYVSIYDFQQSVEDGATVPLYYENRTPELHLTNPTLDDEVHQVIEDAGLDEDTSARLEKVLGKQYHLLTRDDRLDTIADDIVQNFLGRGFFGKAMVVSIDKLTAVRMYNKVQAAWAAETARVKKLIGNFFGDADKRTELLKRLTRLTSVDMAVVVSAGQNEIEDMKRAGVDIVPHRRRMVESTPGLDERFKDPKDPLALVFVCAMWLTGFDAPSCSTLYIDKPMRNHTLMQTITRANRVYPDKHSGAIVDYANVFASLERALAMYGAGGATTTPVRDKEMLVDELRQALAALQAFCAGVGVDVAALESASTATARLTLVGEATSQLLATDALRKAFLAHALLADRLYSALKPKRSALEFVTRMATVMALVDAIKLATAPAKTDIADVLQRIGEVLDRSIEGASIAKDGPAPMDLSRIDFKALAAKFKKSETKNLDLERLKAAIRAQLDRMIEANETRVDFRLKFELLIAAYNAGSMQIEQLFADLLALSQNLSEEQTRHVREQLTEEELVVLDLLTRPGPDLTSQERDEVKKVARQLLARVRSILTADWQKTAQARARMKEQIEEALDEGLPRAYTPDVFKAKSAVLFQHVYERFGRAA